MKKTFFTLTVLLSITASAQLKWGPVAGFSSSNIGPMDLVSTSRLVNVNAGFMADIKISKELHILGQLLYAPLGYEKSNIDAIDNSGNNVGKIEMHRINYIQVPFYLLYGRNLKDLVFNAGLGPFVSFQAGDKLKIMNGDTYRNGTVFPSGIKDINAIITGIGFHISGEWSSVILALHFHQAFNSIYETQVSSAPKWKMNSFGVNLGYFFLKK